MIPFEPRRPSRILRPELRHLAFAVAALAALCAPGVSQAGGGSLGTLGPAAPSASFSDTVFGAFTDTWTFDVTSASALAASLTNVQISLGGADFGGIVDFSATLAGTLLGSTTSVLESNGIAITTQVLADATSGAPGSYTLTVSGSGVTGGSASYGGNLVATPVSEPQTLALFLAGLAAMGFIGHRRAGS
jgi:hypothetical protein